MVTLELGKGITTFDGSPLPWDSAGKPTFVKDLVLHYLGTFNSKNGKSMIEAGALGFKIAAYTESEIQLENAELNIIKEATQNPVHGALIVYQFNAALDEAEKTKTSPSGKKAAEPIPAE